MDKGLRDGLSGTYKYLPLWVANKAIPMGMGRGEREGKWGRVSLMGIKQTSCQPSSPLKLPNVYTGLGRLWQGILGS